MSLLRAEALESPTVVAELLEGGRPAYIALADELRAAPPALVATCARGSSACAALLLRKLLEARMARPVFEVAPSSASVFGARSPLRDGLLLLISQSGASPDLIATALAARRVGAKVVAMVNVKNSPLAGASSGVLPLCAGIETSVAATKSCLAAMAAVLLLTAAWTRDTALLTALARLPEQLEAATRRDASELAAALVSARHIFILGRGPSEAIAREAALKAKEIVGLHAEAFSSAEVLHGPITLAGPKLLVIGFLGGAEGDISTVEALRRCRSMGSPTLSIGPSSEGLESFPEGMSSLLSALLSFYLAAEEAGRVLGRDVGSPPGLQKLTLTR